MRLSRWLSGAILIALNGAAPASAGALNAGRRVQAGGAGLLIVTDPVLDRVGIYDVNGKKPQKIVAFGVPGTEPGEFESPHGAALNAFRELFVVDTMNHRVQVFDLAPLASGRSPRLVRVWGKQGTEPGALDTPVYGLAIPDRTNPDHLLYVADTGNDRIQVFDRHGRPTGLMIGGRGSGEGQLERPGGLAFDPSGTVLYVVDRGHRRVVAFDARTGRFLFDFGRQGQGKGELIAPEGLAVNSEGTIFVADPGGRRVCRFAPDAAASRPAVGRAQYEGAWALVGTQPGFWTHPQSLAIDGNDRVYISDMADGRCQVFSREGGFLSACGEELGLPSGFSLPLEAITALPSSVCSNDGRYQVQVANAPSPIPFNHIFGMEVQLLQGCPGVQPLADATLAVSAVMPEHRHGMTTQPVIESLGRGRFRLAGMLLHMRGRWELNFDIVRDHVLERAQADIVLD